MSWQLRHKHCKRTSRTVGALRKKNVISPSVLWVFSECSLSVLWMISEGSLVIIDTSWDYDEEKNVVHVGNETASAFKTFSLHCLPKIPSSLHFLFPFVCPCYSFHCIFLHFWSIFHSRQFLQMSWLLFYFQCNLSEKSSHLVQTEAMTEIMMAEQFCPPFF